MKIFEFITVIYYLKQNLKYDLIDS